LKYVTSINIVRIILSNCVSYFCAFRYGRDHHIEVDILNYNNPTLKAEIIAELVIPRKTDVDISYGFDEPLQKPAECNIIVRNKKRRKPGKESEIQGALALMELARN